MRVAEQNVEKQVSYSFLVRMQNASALQTVWLLFTVENSRGLWLHKEKDVALRNSNTLQGGNYHPERSRQENYGDKGGWRRNVCVQVITPCSIVDRPSQSETLMGISGLGSYNTMLHLTNGQRPLDQFLQHYEINRILPQNSVVVLTLMWWYLEIQPLEGD